MNIEQYTKTHLEHGEALIVLANMLATHTNLSGDQILPGLIRNTNSLVLFKDELSKYSSLESE